MTNAAVHSSVQRERVAPPLHVLLAGLPGTREPRGNPLMPREEQPPVQQAMGVQVEHWGALSICRSSAAVAAKLSSAGYPASDIHQNGPHSERRIETPPPRPFHIGFCGTAPPPLEMCAYS
jgi:hypothetical protein